MANQGLQYYPEQLELIAERLALSDYVDASSESVVRH
jgi:hypothetical protein